MTTHKSLTNLFTNIASAIRDKTGSAGTIIADDFPSAISNIDTGGDFGNVLTLKEGAYCSKYGSPSYWSWSHTFDSSKKYVVSLVVYQTHSSYTGQYSRLIGIENNAISFDLDFGAVETSSSVGIFVSYDSDTYTLTATTLYRPLSVAVLGVDGDIGTSMYNSYSIEGTSYVGMRGWTWSEMSAYTQGGAGSCWLYKYGQSGIYCINTSSSGDIVVTKDVMSADEKGETTTTTYYMYYNGVAVKASDYIIDGANYTLSLTAP